MKKNIILKMFLILCFTSFIIACKKEVDITPENKPTTPPPSIFAKWNWVQTVGTGSFGSYTMDPQGQGYTISLLLNSDSSFYKMKQLMSTTTSELLDEGKFKFFNINSGGSANSPATGTSPDEIVDRIQFNSGDSLPIRIYPNFEIFDTIVIYNKVKTIADTYVRTK